MPQAHLTLMLRSKMPKFPCRSVRGHWPAEQWTFPANNPITFANWQRKGRATSQCNNWLKFTCICNTANAKEGDTDKKCIVPWVIDDVWQKSRIKRASRSGGALLHWTLKRRWIASAAKIITLNYLRFQYQKPCKEESQRLNRGIRTCSYSHWQWNTQLDTKEVFSGHLYNCFLGLWNRERISPWKGIELSSNGQSPRTWIDSPRDSVVVLLPP